jgi:hypothetical protein
LTEDVYSVTKNRTSTIPIVLIPLKPDPAHQHHRPAIFKNERQEWSATNLSSAALAAFHCSLFSKIEVQTAWKFSLSIPAIANPWILDSGRSSAIESLLHRGDGFLVCGHGRHWRLGKEMGKEQQTI